MTISRIARVGAVVAGLVALVVSPVLAQDGAAPMEDFAPVEDAAEIAPAQNSGSVQELAPVEAPVPAGPESGPNFLSGLTLDELSATRDIPLFTPSRTAPIVEQPFEPAPMAEPEPVYVEPEPVLPPLRLIGIVMLEAEQVALLSDQNTGEVRRIAPGEDYDGWALRIVDARRVEFSNGEQKQTLTMFEPGNLAPPAPPDPYGQNGLYIEPPYQGDPAAPPAGNDPNIDPDTGMILPGPGGEPSANPPAVDAPGAFQAQDQTNVPPPVNFDVNPERQLGQPE